MMVAMDAVCSREQARREKKENEKEQRQQELEKKRQERSQQVALMSEEEKALWMTEKKVSTRTAYTYVHRFAHRVHSFCT